MSLRVRALTKPTMGAYRGTMGRVLAIFWAGPAHVTPPSQPFSAKNGRKTEGAKKTTYTTELRTGILTSILLTIQKSKCRTIKCCGCECNRDPSFKADEPAQGAQL